MWSLKLEPISRANIINLLNLPESEEEWSRLLMEEAEQGIDGTAMREQRLAAMSEQLLRMLPDRFHPYVHDGTINQPNLEAAVREDLLQWYQEQRQQITASIEGAWHAAESLEELVDEQTCKLLQEGFHDGQLLHQLNQADKLTLRLTAGGFNRERYVTIHFENPQIEYKGTELRIGCWWIYSEVRNIEGKIGLRVIWDMPELEWTIIASSVSIECYYKPKAFADLNGYDVQSMDALLAVFAKLEPTFNYYLYTDTETIELLPTAKWQEGLPITASGEGCYMIGEAVYCKHNNKELHIADNSWELIKKLVTDVYENPYEIFSIPLPDEELEDALFGDDLVLRTRAWNTLYNDPQRHPDLINRGLLHLKAVTPDNGELILYVYTGHFSRAGVLTDSTLAEMKEFS
ncbi:DUF4085 family protein [Paenibacillus sp. GXUN7292]|uniref:DUF4085 family protein n=1 Tax=Paenibacillus sp. GXUN7292 TaxID=3422499 RepID=UPI003D7D3233